MFQKLIVLLLMSFYLTACVPAALGVGTTVGIWLGDHRSSKVIASDHKQALVIEGKIKKDRSIYRTSHISVTVFNQVILLVGQTPTYELHDKILTIVKKTAHVKMIYDEIKIQKPIPTNVRKKDTWLTTKAKMQLYAVPGLNATNIKVVTENGVVYIMGLISRAQSELAIKNLQKISGIKKIIKLFEYN